MAQGKVFRHGHFRDQVQLLVNDGHTVMDRLRARAEDVWLIAEDEAPRIGPVDAGEDFQEGAFSGAVFAEEGMHFAAGD